MNNDDVDNAVGIVMRWMDRKFVNAHTAYIPLPWVRACIKKTKASQWASDREVIAASVIGRLNNAPNVQLVPMTFDAHDALFIQLNDGGSMGMIRPNVQYMVYVVTKVDGMHTFMLA